MRVVWVVSSSRIKIGQGGVCLHNNGEGSSGRIEGYAGVGCARFFAHHSDIKRIRYKMLRKKSSAPYELFLLLTYLLCHLPKTVSIKGQNHRDVILRAAKPGRRIRPTREKS